MKNTLIILILLLFFSSLNAQKTYSTQRFQATVPVIDGIFDDEIWQEGDWRSDFSQNSPDNGADASQKTEFKILYDDNYIYVAIKAYDDEPSKIDKRLSRRDSWEGDKVMIKLDSYNDERTAFVFNVTAGGVKNDGILTNDGGNFDGTWNPIWFVKTAFTDDGWTAEMKIPLSQLRFGSQQNQIWGLEVERFIFRNQETDVWQPIPDDVSGHVSYFGKLHGISNIKPKQRIEIAPYVMTKIDLYEAEDGNPYADGSDFGFMAGLDGKIGITNDLTIDFTINPDFGQVEADPSEVNLSAFETFFDEKRDFFIEGNSITDFQLTPGGSPWASDNLFYSRRIGRSPQGFPNLQNDDYFKMPQNTRINGAAKLTGKTQDGWSIGVIESLVGPGKALIYNGGTERKEIIEPLTNYFLGRLQKDINKGNTIIGGIVTSTYRDIPTYNLLFLNKTATTGGINFTQFFKQKKYYISANLSGSHITGDKTAILEQQLSSRRYFQRPDASYLSVDSNRTSLSGHAGTFLFGKNANSGLRYAFAMTWRSPEYETNDMGYLRNANNSFQYVWVSYAITKPFSIFRRININANEWAGWDFGGVNNFSGGNISTWMQFKNLWSFNANATIESQFIDNSALRGGAALFVPGSFNYNLGIGTNQTKKINLHGGFWDNYGFYNSYRTYGFYGNITIRPANTLSVSFSGKYGYYNNQMQYVTQELFDSENKYIFAEIIQNTLDFTIRLDYNITPDFTIQYYGAPFVSSGLYDNYKLITNSKAEVFTDRFHSFSDNEIKYSNESNMYNIFETFASDADYSFDNPNYNFRQFNSNLVLRWEYLAGSVVYLVWSHGRIDYDSQGVFDYSNDIKELFNNKGNNTVLLKFSYRFVN